MPKKILVASSDPAFGEYLQTSLAEGGDYDVSLALSGSEVLNRAATRAFALAILDNGLPGSPLEALARDLRSQNPALRLILIAPDDDPLHAFAAGLAVDGFINRRISMRDLLAAVRSLLAEDGSGQNNQAQPASVKENSQDNPARSWPLYNEQASQALASELPASSAQAALIAQEGRLWLSAGSISQPAGQEISALLSKGWAEQTSTGLARYTRLESTGERNLIYATRLLDELVLALIFEPGASLTRARSQTARVARTLTDIFNQPPVPPLPPQAENQPAQPETEEPAPEELYEDEAPEIDLSVLLAGMPSPDPDGRPLFASDWISEEDLETDPVPTGAEPDSSGEQTQPLTASTPPDETDSDQAGRSGDLPEWFSVFQDSLDRQTPEQTRPAAVPGNGKHSQEVTIRLGQGRPPADAPPPVSADPLTQAGAAFGDLVYTCILLPAQPQHSLSGELADQLGLWLPQMCLAFGWRLEGLIVRPEYLLWVVRLAPGMSAGNVVRILRQRLSESIYQAFPHYRQANRSADFWAPGYLVVRGSRPPSGQQMQDFIDQTRRRQGFPTPGEPKQGPAA